jgi:transcriptional regulator with XRE-family HTH domain
MKVTAETIAAIKAAAKDRGLNQSKLAEAIGLDKTTISKLLKGKIATLKPETEEKLLDKLGLDLRPVQSFAGHISPAMAKLSELSKTNADLAAMLEFLARIATPTPPPPPPTHFPAISCTDLPAVGAQIASLASGAKGAGDPENARLGREVLDWLREYYRAEED